MTSCGWRIVTGAADAARVFLGLGTNLGDRAANLRAAIVALSDVGHVAHLSRVYESEPWGYTDQPRFLNMAALLYTTLAAPELLPALKAIETRLGREPGPRMGPRMIDIDILLYGDAQIESAVLQVPHPGLLSRAFVLAPLLDLDIALCHPVTGEQLADRLHAMNDTALVPIGSANDVLRLGRQP